MGRRYELEKGWAEGAKIFLLKYFFILEPGPTMG